MAAYVLVSNERYASSILQADRNLIIRSDESYYVTYVAWYESYYVTYINL